MSADSPRSPHSPSGYASLALVALAGAVLAVAIQLAIGPSVQADSAQYLSMAHNIAAGRGIATHVIYYEEHYLLGTVPAAQTVFPPGFPALVALVAQLGPSYRSAALGIGLACFVLTAVFLHMLAVRSGLGRVAASVLGFGWLACVFGWFSALTGVTEMPFIALTVLAALLLAGPEVPSTTRAAGAGVAAAAAFLVRYAGVFFVFSVLLYFGLEWLRARRAPGGGGGAWTKAAAAFLAPPAVAAAVMFGRNYALVGALKGGNDFRRMKAFGEVIQTTTRSLSELSGFAPKYAVRGRLGELALLAALACGAAGFAVWRRSLRRRQPVADAARRMATLSAVYVGVSVALLLYLERTTSLGLASRMFLPLVPFAGLFVGCAAHHLEIDGATARRGALGWAALLVVAFAIGQRQAFAHQRGRPDVYARIVDALAVPTAGGSIGDLLRREATDATPLLGNQSQVLAAALGGERPVLGLTSREYSATPWTPARVAATVSRYHVGYVVVFPEVLEDGDDRQPFFDDLTAGVMPEWLELLTVVPSARLYRVKSAAAP